MRWVGLVQSLVVTLMSQAAVSVLGLGVMTRVADGQVPPQTG